MSEQVGFIGLGSMGMPMARNLLAAGYRLRVYNRTPDKARSLAEAGAQVAETPADVAEPGGIVITMLANDAAVEEVTLGEHGLINRLSPGGIHLSMSTISPDTAARLAEEHQRRGSVYVAAPVLGRPEAAAARKLQIIVAGPPAAKERVRPILQALGQGIWDYGEQPSAANVVKVAANFLIVATMESLAEAMALVDKRGVVEKDFLSMLTQTVFACPIYQTYGEAIVERRYMPAGFRLALGLKDLNLVLQTADSAKAPMPIASLTHDRALAAMAKGRGDMDWVSLTLGVFEDAGLA